MPRQRAKNAARRLRIGGATLAAAVLAASTLGFGGAALDPSVRCVYTFDEYHGGFVADVTIINNGPAIDGWTVWWTVSHPTRLGDVWSAVMVQEGDELTATNLEWNRVVPRGGSRNFGWTASAQDTETPTDLTLNGLRCTAQGIDRNPW